MARRGGWRRKGRKGQFRYLDSRGKRITDPEKIERIEELVIPPAWRDVWISPRARAKLQATGVDRAGRRQYLYHPEFRAQQEQEKFDKLVRFAERLPGSSRKAMSEHMEREPFDRRLDVRACDSADQSRLVSCRHRALCAHDPDVRDHDASQESCLRAREPDRVPVPGQAPRLGSDRGRRRGARRRDEGAARAARRQSALSLRRTTDSLCNLTGARLNEYIDEHLGEEFTAKDFRTWGGTLLAAIALAERGSPDTETEAKRVVAGVMRAVGEKLGNTPAVARSSYVSPAVVEQYLDGRTIDDFRPRHLRVVGARDTGLDREERALLALLRSWRIRRARVAA